MSLLPPPRASLTASQGSERIKGAYAYQTLLKASGGVLPLGSDFPVEGINPLLGFYAAVARLDTEGKSPHGEGGWCVSDAYILSKTEYSHRLVGSLRNASHARMRSRA